MGVGCSQSSSAVKPAYAGRSNWRAALSKEEARSLYESDGSVPSGSSNELIHFRTYLEAPICLRAFAMYCKYKDEKLSNYLLCWLDILQFSMISEMDIEKQFDKGFLLYGKYMNGPQLTHIADAPEFTSGPVDSKLDGLTIPSEWYDNTASILQNCKTDNQALPPKLFSEYGRHCLVYLYENAFQSFIRSPGYKESILYLKEKHNVIDVNDFEYIEKVGQGAFGCVVKCVKKSTGKAYAMKIQTKIGLLDSYSDDPSRVCLERNALVKTRHPFIVSLDYAFQTQQLVILVMDLGTKGTLYDAMMNSKRTCLPEKSVVFYAAEIFLALVHIHNAGMIYRDLKPQNVLLNADGHIKLVDMGGIIDVNVAKMESSERIFGEAARNNSYSNMVKKDLSISMSKSAIRKGTTAVSRTGGGLEVKQRATSIMGTEYFMAPEMLVLLTLDRAGWEQDNVGYSKTVDFWSLGITLYNLLTGTLPFRVSEVSQFPVFELAQRADTVPSVSVATIPEDVESVKRNSFVKVDSGDGYTLHKLSHYPACYEKVFHGLGLDGSNDDISKVTCSLVLGLLEINPDRRLGCGYHGARIMRKHAAFTNINWVKLVRGEMVPPSRASDGTSCSISNKVKRNQTDDLEDISDFKPFLEAIGKKRWLAYSPDTSDQKYFENWDYISPETLNIEIKLATQNTVNSSSFFPVPAKGSALKRLCSIFFSSSKLCNEDDLDSRLSSSLEMKNEARGISKNFETISTVFQSISDLNNQDAKISPGK